MSFMLKIGRNLRGLERVWENMQASFVMVIFMFVMLLVCFASVNNNMDEEP